MIRKIIGYCLICLVLQLADAAEWEDPAVYGVNRLAAQAALRPEVHRDYALSLNGALEVSLGEKTRSTHTGLLSCGF